MTISDDVALYNINAITSEKIKLDGEENSAAEDKEKVKREFIDFILYFGALRNHIVIVNSSSLRARDLETYLGWLIHSYSSSFSETSTLMLRGKPSAEVIVKMDSTPV
ncbi:MULTISPECIES: hypothetical protein [Pantoea]|uniref:hypothetical protein n=1 Tax=Pantoea TaxID=53335 RepID=UPI002892CF8B|nr:hypothetical protein [Pantoea sp. UBA5923]